MKKLLLPLFVALLVVMVFSGCSLFIRTGFVEGYIIDATTGSGLPNVTVGVQGERRYSAVSDFLGFFSLEAPIGTQVIIFEFPGYDLEPVTVLVVDGGTTTFQDGEVLASPVLSPGQYRFVLIWGEQPYDLDSHMVTPSAEHISYSNKTGTGLYLDVDDTSSYGPETITITDVATGTYGYYVYNYSGSPDITTSGAIVKVYDATGLLRTIDIPTSGSGLYWNVATLSGSTLTVYNTIESSAPY